VLAAVLRRSLLTAVLTLMVAVPAARAREAVASGPLTATIDADPWQLSFNGAPHSPGLRQDTATGTGPVGRLGFLTPGGWRRATHVLSSHRSGRAYEATMATTDPAGRQIAVRLAPDASGVIALDARVVGATVADVSATGISFAAAGTERFLGFGERSNAVDQRGATVENRVTEGPYQANEQPFVAGFVPQPGQNSRTDATYFPIPWLLSTRGFGVLVDNDEISSFHLASDRADAWSVQASAPNLRLRVFAGPRPADVLRRLTARLGRQPRAAAPWYFGPWFQPAKGHDEGDDLRTLRRADAPVSVAQTYTHYLPCADHIAKGRAQQRDRTRYFHAEGLAVTTYFNPMICTNHPRYAAAKAAGLLTKNALGQPYEYRYTGSAQFRVGQFDFSNPAATPFYANLLGEATQDGYNGWMEDFGEYTPTDARSYDGTPGDQMHNRYVLLYHRAAYDFSRRSGQALARFNRSGWRGSARYSQLVWGGDPTTDWGFDGLASAVRNGLSMGLSGVSLWGSDIGGFFGLLGQHQLTPELLDRWIEVGAVSGVMRTQANGSRVPDDGKRRAQIFDPGVLPVWRRYAKLRTQLYPYLAAAEAEYDRTGLPIMRDLALAFGREGAANRRDDEFVFGPDLLAAPVITPGQRSRSVYLPPGRWVDLWRSAHTTRSGAVALGRAKAAAGSRTVSVPAPVAELPLMARAGAVIPLLAPDVDTLTRLGHASGVVHAAERESRRQLLAFPRGHTGGALGVGERWASAEGRSSWALRIAAHRTRTYTLQASLSTLSRPFGPCGVRIGRRALSRRAWRYDARTRVLHATFRARSGRLLVSARCPR
jgi:alpha-glucosidase (family GH31 glycosyl hydrolase)